MAYLNSTTKKIIEKRKAKIHKTINETLFDHLLKPQNIDSDKKYAEYINQTFTTDYPRLVFINRLRRIISLSTANINSHCIQIFKLSLPESLIKAYVLSPYKRHKLFALKVIGEFKMCNFEKHITRLMKSKDRDICSKAIYTYIRINENTNLNFLVKRNKQISRLDFFNIIQITEKYLNIDYYSLINAEETSLSALGIKLVSIHNEKELKPQIIKRLNHPSKLVRDQAQDAFLDMIEIKDAHLLLKHFDMFNIKNQKNILIILKDIAQNSQIISFFEKIIETHNNHIKLEAMRILLELDFMNVLKYSTHENEDIRKIFKQLTDFNL